VTKESSVDADVYKVAASFPKDERFGMTSQMRRCAASVPANIAEGCGRGGVGEMARFLGIAQRCFSELAYYFILARDLEMVNAETMDALASQADEIGRMLTSYINKLRTNSE